MANQMVKPKVRSACVDSHIKMAYAKLAQAHFNEATVEVKLAPSSARQATDARMIVVEDYLERAGAAATRWGFRS